MLVQIIAESSLTTKLLLKEFAVEPPFNICQFKAHIYCSVYWFIYSIKWSRIINLHLKFPPFKIFLCLLFSFTVLQRNHTWEFCCNKNVMNFTVKRLITTDLIASYFWIICWWKDFVSLYKIYGFHSGENSFCDVWIITLFSQTNGQ